MSTARKIQYHPSQLPLLGAEGLVRLAEGARTKNAPKYVGVPLCMSSRLWYRVVGDGRASTRQRRAIALYEHLWLNGLDSCGLNHWNLAAMAVRLGTTVPRIAEGLGDLGEIVASTVNLETREAWTHLPDQHAFNVVTADQLKFVVAKLALCPPGAAHRSAEGMPLVREARASVENGPEPANSGAYRKADPDPDTEPEPDYHSGARGGGGDRLQKAMYKCALVDKGERVKWWGQDDLDSLVAAGHRFTAAQAADIRSRGLTIPEGSAPAQRPYNTPMVASDGTVEWRTTNALWRYSPDNGCQWTYSENDSECQVLADEDKAVRDGVNVGDCARAWREYMVEYRGDVVK